MAIAPKGQTAVSSIVAKAGRRKTCASSKICQRRAKDAKQAGKVSLKSIILQNKLSQPES